MNTGGSIAAKAAQDSEYPPSVWDFVASDMAHRVDVFGSAQEVAHAYAQQVINDAASPMTHKNTKHAASAVACNTAMRQTACADDGCTGSANPANRAPDAAAVNLIQEAILEEARREPLPRLSGEVLAGAEIFREDPFTRYGGPPNGATDARIGWYTNAMVAVTYAIDEEGTCACAAIDITTPHEPRLTEFVREVAGQAHRVTSAESRLIANACVDAGVPYREARADTPELSPLRALREEIAPIMMEATKGAEASYVDGNLRWYSLVSQENLGA